jgi:uncharacterized membrane protein
VLPLVIGVVVIVLAALAVVTDASVLWLQRRSLQSVVDGAALAGAQGIDTDLVYAEGVPDQLPLDPAAARAAVRSWVRTAPATRELTRFRVVRTTVTATTVTVRARSIVTPPFTAFLTGRGVTVVAEATATPRGR